jgi:hypothetical protein
MANGSRRPAYYAARSGGWRDWWTLLHPPYTAWHLSYVVIGACLAPKVDAERLLATLLAFFGAVGIGAHALDELHGRPLRTRISNGMLIAAATVGLAVAVALGVAGIARVGVILAPFILVGPALVVAYNIELFGGLVHTDIGFALAWGSFPVLVGYVAQAGGLRPAAVVAAAAACALSLGQRALSTQARTIRRRVTSVRGALTFVDGTIRPVDETVLLEPVERALRALSWGFTALAAAMAVARLY